MLSLGPGEHGSWWHVLLLTQQRLWPSAEGLPCNLRLTRAHGWWVRVCWLTGVLCTAEGEAEVSECFWALSGGKVPFW